jgi:hypothetical protein
MQGTIRRPVRLGIGEVPMASVYAAIAVNLVP